MEEFNYAVSELARQGFLLALVASLILGVRHAIDPDHVSAVLTLVLCESPRKLKRRARQLGFAWGLGHAATLLAFGVPLVLFGPYLPDAAERAVGVLVGAGVVALAARLVIHWRRGYFDLDTEERPRSRRKRLDSPGRSLRTSFGMGLLHGLSGSAAVSLLLIGTLSAREEAVAALMVFACGTAASMALLSSAVGVVAATDRVAQRMYVAVPAVATLSVVIGVWYVSAAIGP